MWLCSWLSATLAVSKGDAKNVQVVRTLATGITTIQAEDKVLEVEARLQGSFNHVTHFPIRILIIKVTDVRFSVVHIKAGTP